MDLIRKEQVIRTVALIATIEFCQRNGHPWTPPAGDGGGAETAMRFFELAALP